jgi:small subunit ribosomal protein S2
MAPYIWGHRSDVHLIDVSKTAAQLERACKFLEGVASEGKQILWVGTKKPARDLVIETGKALNMPYVYHRWVGGTLSNYGQVKKSITKLMHYEDVLTKSEKFPHYTKKEYTVFQKMLERLTKNVGGIRNLIWPVGAIVLVDVSKERSALKEAAITGIPVVALVDTNGDPTSVDYVIPGNDDAPKSIKLILDYLAEAARKGATVAAEKPKEQQQGTQEEMGERERLLAGVERAEDEEGGSKRGRSTKGVSTPPRPMANRGSRPSARPGVKKG